MFMTDSLRKLRKENPQMIKNWFPTMCMILIVKNKMFMVFERMREMIGKQIRFVVGSSYEPSFCLCISSACNLAVPVRGAKECWTRAKVSWELLWVGSTAHWPPLDLDEWGVSSQEEGRVVDDTTTHWSFDCFWLVDDIEWSLCAWVLPMKNLE